MQIIPNVDILIDGQHCPAGDALETSTATAKALIAEGLARLTPTATADDESEPVETAEAAPESEKSARPRKSKNPEAAPESAPEA